MKDHNSLGVDPGAGESPTEALSIHISPWVAYITRELSVPVDPTMQKAC
jgi:hypothetical protein